MRLFLFLFALGLANAGAAPDELWLAAVEGRSIGDVDSAVKPYYSRATQKALGLAGLHLLDTEKEPLVPGQKSMAKFKGGYTVEVNCLGQRPTKYLMELALADRDGPILHTQVEIARGSPIILAGPFENDTRLLFFVVIR